MQEASDYLNQLDLNYIVETMCSNTYPLPQWRLDEAKHCMKLYKNFLWLQKKYLPQSLVPTRQIDEFWHNHILYTRNYTRDCMKIFGHYLHHEPAGQDNGQGELLQDYIKTKQLYLNEFKQPMDLIATQAT